MSIHRHLEARRTERSLLGIVLFVIGVGLVLAVLASEFRNPFAVLTERINAQISATQGE